VKISTRGRYAVRAIMYLAGKYGQAPVPLNVISRDQELSVKYLENIMRTLISSGIVVSTKGKAGGYIMAKPPEKVTAADILCITEGSLSPVDCLDNCFACSRSKACASREMWGGLGKAIMDYLASVTVAQLVKNQKICESGTQSSRLLKNMVQSAIK
jgi:Rrf2 family protein